MQAPLNQTFLVQPIEHSDESDRFDVEHRRDGRSTLALVTAIWSDARDARNCAATAGRYRE